MPCWQQDSVLLTGAFGGNLTLPPPFLALSKNNLSSSVWPRREYTWTFNWKESLLNCYESCQSVPYTHRQSWNRMMNTFIIVDITPTCERCPLQKGLLLSSIWPGTEYTWVLISNSLLISFESYPVIPYSHKGSLDNGWWKTLLIVNIKAMCERFLSYVLLVMCFYLMCFWLYPIKIVISLSL